MTDDKKYPDGIAKAMLGAIDSILAVRDATGAIVQPVYAITRTWSGAEPGDGTSTDETCQILPTPGLKEFSQDIRLKEGGNIKSGDIILTNISRNRYTQADLDSVTASKNIEKFYKVGVKLYTVIRVREKLVTFDVHLRELTNQTR